MGASVACDKVATENTGIKSASGDGQIELNVTGVLGEYMADGTKATLVNRIRVGWNPGDIVLVFGKTDAKYLGHLTTAAQTVAGASTAKLNGSIASPGTAGADLVFVHMSGITQTDVDQTGAGRKFTVGSSYPDVALDLSSQGDDIPFMVFGSAAFTAEAVSNLSVDFNFATSVISTYASGLLSGGSVAGATIIKVNTAGSLHIKDLTVSASTPGRISRTVSAGINAAGQVLFDIAVPKCDALPAGSSPRMIEIAVSSTDHKVYFATFTGGQAIDYGKAYSVMAESSLAYADAIDNGLTHYFSSRFDQKLRFSKGNLYYSGSAWGFEEKQYYFRTYSDDTHDGGKCDASGYNASTGTADGDWGLFGWSTDLSPDECHYGKSTSTDDNDYSGKFKDWGKNAISGSPADTWRTLSNDEWKWIVTTGDNPVPGSNCRRSSMVGGTANARFMKCTVAGVPGFLLFPDYFVWPTDENAPEESTAIKVNDDYADFSISYSDAQFNTLEAAGAVFFPAAGQRNGTEVSAIGVSGLYWSSSSDHYDKPSCYRFAFSEFFGVPHSGYAVRLVTN